MGRPTLRGTRLPLRQLVYEIVAPHEEGRRYPRLSVAFDVFILLCIVGSCVLVPLENAYPKRERLWLVLEMTATIIFVAEYLLRWYSAPNRLRYPFTFYALIDLVAIVPSLLALTAHMLMLRTLRGIRLLRLLRLLRLVRVLRLIRYGPLVHAWVVNLRILYSALDYQYHLHRLRRLVVWVVLAWFIGANLVYFTEHNIVGARGPFGDYLKSYWHVVIVLVSGIEDKEPLSWLGRVEVTLLLIAGIIVVGMLTGEIVSILVKRTQRAGKVAVLPPTLEIERHVLVLGTNAHLSNVIRQVRAALGDQHFIVCVHEDAEDMAATDPAIYRRVFGFSGDPVDVRVLERAGVDRAMRVIVLSSDPSASSDSLGRLDDTALMQTLAVVARRRRGREHGEVPIVVELQAPESLRYAEHLDDVEFVVSRHFGETLLSQAVLSPGVTDVYGQLLTFTAETPEFYTVPVPEPLVGMRYRDAALHYLERDDDDITLIGIDRSPPERPSTRFWLNPERTLPEEQRVLTADDKLIVISHQRPNPKAISPEDRWTGKVLSRG